MAANPDQLRRVLRSGPGVLARTITHPAVRKALATASDEPASVAPMDELPVQTIADPLFDTFDEGDEIVVVGDLPDVQEAQIRIYAYATSIVIHIRGRGDRYSIPLPCSIDQSSLRHAFRNGVLTVHARQMKPQVERAVGY